MTNKEKFLKLASKEETKSLERALVRKKRRKFLRVSGQIAIKILTRLDELNWTQKELAEKMNISPQQINKWIKGNSNFKLETLIDLGNTLGVNLIEVPEKRPSVYKSKTFLSENSRYENKVKIIKFNSAVEVSQTSTYRNRFRKKVAN